MKPVNVFALVVIGIYSCLWSAEDHSEFDVLGQRFVRAVAANDIIQFAHCWIGRKRIVKLGTEMAEKQTPEISDKIMRELAQLGSSLDKRNQNLIYGFKALCEHVQTHAQLSTLELVSVSGRITEKMGVKKTSMFTLVMKSEGKTFTLRIDDGLYDGKQWYFSDSMLSVSSGDKRTSLTISRK